LFHEPFSHSAALFLKGLKHHAMMACIAWHSTMQTSLLELFNSSRVEAVGKRNVAACSFWACLLP